MGQLLSSKAPFPILFFMCSRFLRLPRMQAARSPGPDNGYDDPSVLPSYIAILMWLRLVGAVQGIRLGWDADQVEAWHEESCGDWWTLFDERSGRGEGGTSNPAGLAHCPLQGQGGQDASGAIVRVRRRGKRDDQACRPH